MGDYNKIIQENAVQRVENIKAFSAGVGEDAIQDEITTSTISIEVANQDAKKIHDILQKSEDGINTILFEDSSKGTGTTEFGVDLSNASEKTLKALNSYYQRSESVAEHAVTLSEA